MLEIAIVAQLVAKDKAKGNCCACFGASLAGQSPHEFPRT
jgi:hypothetical protein